MLTHHAIETAATLDIGDVVLVSGELFRITELHRYVTRPSELVVEPVTQELKKRPADWIEGN